LPDNETFDEDLTAWTVDDILKRVFDVPEMWSSEIALKLKELRASVSSSGLEDRAVALYHELAGRGVHLRAECDKILALYADAPLRDRIRNMEFGNRTGVSR